MGRSMLVTHQPPQPNAARLPADERDLRCADRIAAGRRLAQLLLPTRDSQAVILALPPGGIVVGSAIARMLRLPLEALVARTFTIRPYPHFVAGALSEGGGLCVNRAVLRLPEASLLAIWQEARRATRENMALVKYYREDRALPPLQRRPVILVDDGLEDGLAQMAAIAVLRHMHVGSCIVATPRASQQALEQVAQRADRVVALNDHDGLPDAEIPWHHAIDDDLAAAILHETRGGDAPCS